MPPGEWPTATALVRFARGTASSTRASARAAVGTDLDVAYRIVPGLERLKVRPGRTVEETVATLSRNPNVLYVEPDFVVRATAQPNDPSYPSLWGMANINASAAWDVTTGSEEVVVAVLDTRTGTGTARMWQARSARSVTTASAWSVSTGG
jgi:thermitase